MKAGIFKGPRNIAVEQVPEPKIILPTDAIVKITYSCICGSDLWYYRGISKREKDSRIGHEFLGVVESVGDKVTNVKKGDTVVASFTYQDGTCPVCKNGVTSACLHGGGWGQETGGGQGEKVRVPFADGTLFVIPPTATQEQMPALLTLSDVMCTGYDAAVSAKVSTGNTVVVVGDGAVGLCAVLSCKRLGAKRIILMSRNAERTAIGKQFGATDIVSERGEEGIAKVKALTENIGADAVLECVGSKDSWETAFEIVRAGGTIGYVGVPHDVEIPIMKMFRSNIGINGGVAPVAIYVPELMPDILSGKIDPSPVFTKTVALGDLAEGYKAMDERTAIKVLVRP